MKMQEILKVARELASAEAEVPEGLWEKIRRRLNTDRSKIKLSCSICSKKFQPTNSQRQKAARGKNVVCGEGCRSILSSRTASHTNTLYASARMTKHNPMSHPESVKKMKHTLKRIGHKPLVRGGNGKGLTPAEKVLSDATGLLPYIVNTHGGRKNGYPTHYKLDLADPEHMLGIEVDGNSHGLLSRQAQDRKKTEFLEALGWTVLRFTNQQVLEEVEKCCATIKTTALTLSSRNT